MGDLTVTTDVKQIFFNFSCIGMWNRLPCEVVESGYLSASKSPLGTFLGDAFLNIDMNTLHLCLKSWEFFCCFAGSHNALPILLFFDVFCDVFTSKWQC